MPRKALLVATVAVLGTVVTGSPMLAGLQRLRTDYALWAKTCVRIVDKEKRLVPLVLNRAQQVLDAAEREELARRGTARLYVLKGRQGGITTDQQGRALHCIWSVPRSVAMTLTEKRDKTDKVFEITRRAVAHFPRALLPRVGGRETREIGFPALDSHFYTETAGSGRAIAGLSLSRLHASEFAHYEDPDETLKVAEPAMLPVGSVVVLETTAAGYDTPGHQFWKKSAEGGSGYRTIFLPWWDCDPVYYRRPLLEPDELGQIEEDEQELVTQQGLTLEHIAWRRAQIAKTGREGFLQEYAEDPDSCWMAGGSMFYSTALLKILMQRVPTPREVEMGGALEIFADPPPGERVIIGADVAEGGGGDRSTWVARSFPSWTLLAAFQDNRIEPREFAGVLDVWGRRYGLALEVVEKNGHGITVLRTLRDDLKYNLWRLYHRVAQDREWDENSERLGWATTGETKPILLDVGRELLNAAKSGTASVPSVHALRDALSVQRDDNGKIELTGRDMWVAECLAWIGRSAPFHEAYVV